MDEKKQSLVIFLVALFGVVILISILFIPKPRDQASANGAYQINMPLVMKRLNVAPGTVKGIVVDATTSKPKESARVCYKTQCTITDKNGLYVLNGIPYGLQILMARADYFFEKESPVIVRGGGVTDLNFAIYPQISGGTRAMQIVLTWRSERTWPGAGCVFEGNPDPSGNCLNDLDSHLWIIPINTSLPRYHIHPRNKGNCNQFPSACLDLDAQWGSGPETLTIAAYEDVNYYYAVHNVYQYFSLTVPHISNTQARVQVFKKADNGKPNLVLDKYVPITGGSRDLEAWFVFTLDGSQRGDPVLKNCLTTIWPSEYEPPTCP